MRAWMSLPLLLTGCSGGDVEPQPIELQVEAATADAMPTVLTVTVTTSEDAPVHLEYGEGDAFDRTTDDDAGGTSHSFTLVGLPQGAAIGVRAVSGADSSADVSVTTGILDAPSPVVEAGELGSYVALPMLEDGETWAVVLDPQARVVWAWRDTSGLATFRVRVARDGSGILYNRADADSTPDAALVHVTWDGVQTVRSVPTLGHDFVDREDGTVVALGYEVRDSVEANTLIEIADDGSTTTLWTAWDCFDPVNNPGDDPAHGWTHANALDEDGDGWLVGMRNLSTIARVDADGSCPWAIGGTGGTLTIDGAKFEHQHQFELDGDVLHVFDNDGAPGNASRVLTYALDLGAGTATQSGSLAADPPFYSFILGDVHDVDGLSMVVWSTANTIDRYDATGALAARITVPGGGRLGFADVHDELVAR
ncbi:MAG: aryl-sulfate sulfotransferase [Myxococcales bacterium]|nr:aryl-sulfate sulfotransferase [Myxococcales bacterium]